MGFCLDPSDCNLQIIWLSVGPFRAYPYDNDGGKYINDIFSQAEYE